MVANSSERFFGFVFVLVEIADKCPWVVVPMNTVYDIILDTLFIIRKIRQ